MQQWLGDTRACIGNTDNAITLAQASLLPPGQINKIVLSFFLPHCPEPKSCCWVITDNRDWAQEQNTWSNDSEEKRSTF